MAKPPARRNGRPSRYSPDLATEILHRMAGGETLTSICAAPGMPCHSTVRLWAVEDREGFSARYARAREAQAHAIAEAALDGALAASDAAAGRLHFDARRWFAGKMMPRLYGERAEPQATSPENPLVVLIRDMKARALPIAHQLTLEAEDER